MRGGHGDLEAAWKTESGSCRAGRGGRRTRRIDCAAEESWRRGLKRRFRVLQCMAMRLLAWRWRRGCRERDVYGRGLGLLQHE